MDPLVEISRSDLHKLRDLYRGSWPYGVEGYCLLSTQLSCPDLSKVYNFKFYCPEGDISHGMVTISDKRHYYEVYICPTTDKAVTVLENALENTRIIDWNREVTVPSANSDVLACLKRLRDKLSLKLTYESRVCKYLLDKSVRPYENLELPENTYVGPIKKEHLDLVNRTWTFYSGQGSYDNFETLMKNGLTYALYSSEDHRLLAWIAVDNAGAFTHLYCLGAYRRKGYSEYITKIATNDRLSQGKDVLTYTLEENVKPQNLFNKLGFDFLGYVWWVCLTTKT